MSASLVGSYRIVGPLGTGGMGTVYCAEHALIGRPAAVKVLLPQYGRDRSIVTRFFNEARAVSAINHPGIVELYDFGYMDDGSAYIVMELLRGETLASRIYSRGCLTEVETLSIVRGIAGALAAVHARGIVHRDIKPENVFLVPDLDAASGERVKVLDFGIAKLGDDQGALNHTSVDAMLGTPLYMAPEQCRGAGQVDHRADLYGLGCVMFEMLTGEPPFMGEGAGEVIGAHLHVEPPAVRSLAPEVSQHTAQVVAALLAKRPDDRPQSAHDLLQLLQHPSGPAPSSSATQVTLRLTGADSHPAISTTLGSAAGIVVLPPAPHRPRAFIAAGAVVTALAAAAIALVVSIRGGDDRARSLQAPSSAIDALAAPPPAMPGPGVESPGIEPPPVPVATPGVGPLPEPIGTPGTASSAERSPEPAVERSAEPVPRSAIEPIARSPSAPPPGRTRRSPDSKKSAPRPEAPPRRAPVVEDL
jgi:eukaryotic-like serine/threonine-protein kinase